MQYFEIVYRRDAVDMIEKIWRAAQIRNLLDLQEKYNIPLEVIKAVEHIAAILDAEYGMEREVDHDDGGYVLLLLPEKDTDDVEILYHCLLEECGLRYGMAEMESMICMDNGLEWWAELYLTTNDYGITVIYSKRAL